MTESKPSEQYAAPADVVNPAASSGNGNTPHELTIDEQSRQEAMAKAMLDNRKRQREQACGAEIDAAITEILKRHKCAVKFMEIREGGQTTRIWLQPVAVDDPLSEQR